MSARDGARKGTKMSKKILITGGAGFIGSHLADDLLLHGFNIRVLDSLSDQVHGTCVRPEYLSPEVDLHCGDVRDSNVVKKALQGVDAIFHLAARVGVGQSMYEIAEYTSVNNQGTANLLQTLIEHPVERAELSARGLTV
jgi:dTDP-L-rhamnose 4-epimerase